MKTHKIIVLCIAVLIGFAGVTSCNDDDVHYPYTGLEENRIIIHDIQNLPEGLEIDYLSAEIQGTEWSVISTVKGYREGNVFVMELPKSFDPDLLLPCQWKTGEIGSGYWPAKSSDPMAGIASLGDIIAYDADGVVGRVFLSDWDGGDDSLGNSFIHFHYAQTAFSLSGNNLNHHNSEMFKPSYVYYADFLPGWNVFANVNPSSDGGKIKCTTDVPDGLNLQWRFEKWK